MSDREVERLYLLERVETGLITQRHAAAMLGITDRQVRRLLQRYRREGAAGLVSRRRGKPSNRRIAEAVKSEVMERVEARYADFGPPWRPSICGRRVSCSPRRRCAAG